MNENIYKYLQACTLNQDHACTCARQGQYIVCGGVREVGDLLTALGGSRKYKLSEKMSKLLGFMCEVKLGSGRKEGRRAGMRHEAHTAKANIPTFDTIISFSCF